MTVGNMTEGKLINNKLKVLIVVISVTSLLVGSVISNRSLAADPSIITDRPLSESFPLLKITNLSTVQSISVNSDLELQANPNNFGLSFVVTNKGLIPAVVDVDRWNMTISGEWDVANYTTTDNSDIIVPAAVSMPITSVDLSDLSEFFEVFPGTYSVKLVGWKFGEKTVSSKFGETFGEKILDDEIRRGNFKEYMLELNVTIDYDIDRIKASPHKLLKASGMQLGIEGTGNPFEIGNNSPKNVVFYITNSGSNKISSVTADSHMEIWNLEQRFPGMVTDTIVEPRKDFCQSLNPGERKQLSIYEFSKENWPIGKYGIAEQLGTQNPVPGIYIVHIEEGTSACTLASGEEVRGSTHSMIIAFEVKP
ncbi:MAG: hypothetical protein HMLIMOIP_002310 [Candidatus Nitrosomirales archaeon]|jgi:hypothetical protein